MPYTNSRGVVMPESAAEQARISGTSAGNETLQAPAGNSSVSGEGGGDLLIGSFGDNRFWITHPEDRVIENAGGGIDTMIGWTSIKLAPNVENLQVNNPFNYAVGNDLDNLIIVDNSTHWIYGGRGDDVLVGALTEKTTFVVRAGEGSDVIYNWNGNDQLQLWGYGFNTAAEIKGAMTQQGADVVLRLNASETLTFRGTTLGAFADRQFLLPLDTAKLGPITFEDNFNSLSIYDPSLRTGTWRADFGGNLKDEWAYTLTSNGERQVYTQPGFYGQGEYALGFQPTSVSGGMLTITAERIPDHMRDAAWGREYSSGMLNTMGIFEQKYGYFEMRAELPTALGTWPAFWMMPTPYVAQVEADIMEGLAATPHVDYRRAWGGDVNLYDNAYKIDPSGFHTYGMLWTPETVTFYYDRMAVLQAPTPANWTEPMAMIVNMAVGGWGGEPNSLQFPASMKVDYVRAYNLADGSAVIERGEPEPPAATMRASGGTTSGQANAPVTFEDTGQPVTSAGIAVFTAKPANPGPGQKFVIWEDAGAVFGAAWNGSSYDVATPLMAGRSNVFTGTGTWLSDGKVALGYMQPAGAGQAAWVMIFDPVKHTFIRHELGPSTGDIDIVATRNGGFAASWDAPGGKVHGRGYDAFAYDGEGWFGPVRQLTGDLTGITASGKLIAESGSGQQLYDLINPPRGVNAVVSIGPMAGVTRPEGDSDSTVFTFALTRDFDLSERVTVGWTVRGQGANPADAQDFVGGVLPSGVVTFEINQATATISVQVQGDTVREPDEQFVVTLVNPVGAKLGQATATGFITNDDSGGTPPPPGGGQVIDSPGPGSTLTGGAGNDTLNASQGADVLTGGGGADTFAWAREPWSPARITDFQLGADRLDFSALFQASGYAGADPVADRYITFLDDGAGGTKVLFDRDGIGTAQPWPNYILQLSGVSPNGLTWAQLSGGAAPPPPSSPVVGFSTTTRTLAEGDTGITAFVFTVTRSGPTTGVSSVNWSASGSGSSPAAPSDFHGGTFGSGVLSFAAGEASKTITVNVAGDTTFEPDETFVVTLSGPSGATLGTAKATGTITNDDPEPGGGGAGRVINSPGPGSTLTGGAGADTLNASQGSDVLTGGAGADVFAWAREPWSPARVTDFQLGTDKLDLSALFQGAGYAGADPVADRYIVFLDDGAGGTKVLFDRDGAGSAQPWPNYILQLEHVPTAGLTWAQLAGGGASPPPPSSPVIGFATTTLSQAEGNSGATAFAFTITRTGPTTGTSSAHWAVSGSGSNPANGADFTGGALPSGTVTFAAGETSRTISVNVAGDTTVEPNETFRVTLSNPTGATLGTTTATGTITNDDGSGGGGGAGRVINSPGPGSTLVGGAGPDTLNASQGSDVLTGGDGADRFVFAKENWSPAEITDFTPGVDKIDLRGMFDAVGYAGTDPLGARYLSLISDGAGGTKVLFDRDAAGPDPQWPNYVIHIQGVAPAQIQPSDWIFQ